MRSSGVFLLFFAVAIVSLALVANYASVQCQEQVDHQQVAAAEKPDGSARLRFQLPKIFDFELYKRLFKRAYQGLEETVRRKFMLARAFRAWITSIKYKFRRCSYYLAINEFSDKSPEELDRMRNHRLGGRSRGKNLAHQVGGANSNQTGQVIPEADPNNIEEALRKLTTVDLSNEHIEGLKELQDELKREQQATVGGRTKRQVDQVQPRRLDIDQLISNGTGASLDPETAAKVVYRPDSNNPDYEAPEVTSFGLRDDYEPVTYFEHGLSDKRAQGIANFFQRYNRVLYEVVDDAEEEKKKAWMNKKAANGEKQVDQELPDEVFFDHRQSKCMFLPRGQRGCGACYAFSAISIAEWLYCKQTGKLTPFSEQYLVDCGKASKVTDGCEGASEFDPVDFINNYGLELLVNYPYRAREDSCPYDEPGVDPKSMGYIRMPLAVTSIIPLDKFEQYVHVAPMAVSISTENGFVEYGGGVHDGVGCGNEADHLVTLVGHGREDGQEYWLLRNSFDVGWGEQGHYKLAKSSGCIPEGYGLLYGTKDPDESVSFKAKKNHRHNISAIKSHYATNLRRALKNREI